MHNIRTKYLLRMSIFIILTIGGLTLIYNFFAEDFYIREKKKSMNEIYRQIADMNLDKLSDKENAVLDEYSEQGIQILVIQQNEIIYSTYKKRREEDLIKRTMENCLELYVEDARSAMEEDGSAIKLRGKVIQNETEYYVYISIKLRTLKSSITFMSKFLIVELIIILGIGIPFSIYMANKTIKPIEEIGEMTRKMGKNEYTEKEVYAFADDEIGELAENIKEMYNQITNNINEMNNYNYILKMQNRDLIKFEERRTEFINMATHELKTPLAIISSQLEMMNLDNSDIMAEYYDSIMEEIQKMSNLIRNILKSSFDDKVLKKVELEKGNLSDLIENLKGKYSVWLNTKHFRSNFYIEDDIYIKMNPEQIEQALNNYIINAYEHTNTNGNIDVSLTKRDNKAVISVYNDGENIAPEKINLIWDSFYSEKKEKSNSNVGLGLYIVHDIVKYHEGTCYAVNMPKGVKFCMEFDLFSEL